MSELELESNFSKILRFSMKNSGRGGRIPPLAEDLGMTCPKKNIPKFFPDFPRIMWECRACPTLAEVMWKIGNLPHVALGRISLSFSKLKPEGALRAFFCGKTGISMQEG